MRSPGSLPQREFVSDNAGNHWRDGDSDSKQDIARRLPSSRLNVGSCAALALDTDLPRNHWKEKKHDQRYKYHRGDDGITIHPHSSVASAYRASASGRTCVGHGRTYSYSFVNRSRTWHHRSTTKGVEKEYCLSLIECENRVAPGKPAESFAKDRRVQIPEQPLYTYVPLTGILRIP